MASESATIYVHPALSSDARHNSKDGQLVEFSGGLPLTTPLLLAALKAEDLEALDCNVSGDAVKAWQFLPHTGRFNKLNNKAFKFDLSFREYIKDPHVTIVVAPSGAPVEELSPDFFGLARRVDVGISPAEEPLQIESDDENPNSKRKLEQCIGFIPDDESDDDEGEGAGEGDDDVDVTSGAIALAQIEHYQKTRRLLIRKETFRPFAREILKAEREARRGECEARAAEGKTGAERLRLPDGIATGFTRNAYLALQLAAENYLVEVFRAANIAGLHARRSRIVPQDIQAALAIKNERT
eukprot:tig00000219_g19488.t1